MPMSPAKSSERSDVSSQARLRQRFPRIRPNDRRISFRRLRSRTRRGRGQRSLRDARRSPAGLVRLRRELDLWSERASQTASGASASPGERLGPRWPRPRPRRRSTPARRSTDTGGRGMKRPSNAAELARQAAGDAEARRRTLTASSAFGGRGVVGQVATATAYEALLYRSRALCLRPTAGT